MKILPVLGKQKGVSKFWRGILKAGGKEKYDQPDMIVVLGGDGTFLGAQRRYYKKKVPFVGVGFGRINFLLNRSFRDPELFYNRLVEKNKWKKFSMRGIRAFMQTESGQSEGVAFNDVYVKSLNPAGVVNLSLRSREYNNLEVSGDGLIVASPQGSTAYNRVAGGTILPLESNLWCVTGICTAEKLHTTVLPGEIHIKILRGPAVAVIDNQIYKRVRKIKIVPADYLTEIWINPRENFEQRRYR